MKGFEKRRRNNVDSLRWKATVGSFEEIKMKVSQHHPHCHHHTGMFNTIYKMYSSCWTNKQASRLRVHMMTLY